MGVKKSEENGSGSHYEGNKGVRSCFLVSRETKGS
jgi:hypothetical protein